MPLIAAEDTRITRRLLGRYEITTRQVSYHARKRPGASRSCSRTCAAGRDLALVTDAGTPLVSDPGAALVAAWAAEGGRVVPIPGASAVLAALVASGLPAARWGFEGFLPRRGRERRERLARVAADERATVLFEAPGRSAATLRDLAAACGEDRPAALARELTKVHESIWRGGLGALAARAAAEPPRGEVTIVVAGRARADRAGGARAGRPGPGPRGGGRARRGGLSRSEAARRVAARTGLPRRELFREG